MLSILVLLLSGCGGVKADGYVTIKWENGNIKAMGTNMNSLPTGLWIENHTNGRLKSKGYYSVTNGVSQKQGVWMEYSEEKNIIISQSSYKNNQMDGMFITFHDNGATNLAIPFVKNKKEGEANSYHPNGKLNKNGTFKNNLKEGKWISHYENGKLFTEELFVKSEKKGNYSEYLDNGQKSKNGNYLANLKSGSWTTWDDKGKVTSKGNYKEDIKEGNWIFNRKGKIEGEVSFKNGMTNGLAKLYDEDGKLSFKATYSDNSRSGAATLYFPNGKIMAEGFYKMISKKSRETMSDPKYDEKVGVWKVYDKVGNLVRKGPYANGKANGEHIEYYPGKKVKNRGPYKFGTKKGLFTYFDQAGKMTKQITFASTLSMRGQMYFYNKGKLQYEFTVGITVMEENELLKDGKPNIENLSGTYIEYFSDGKTIKIKGYFKKMMGKEGSWSYFNKDGSPEHTENWRMGDKAGEWLYYQNGAVIKKENYKMGDLVQ